jgi:hypothetical protein
MKLLKKNLLIALCALTSGISLMGCTPEITMVPFDNAVHGQDARALYTTARIPANTSNDVKEYSMPSVLEGTTDTLAVHAERIGTQEASVFFINNEMAGIALYNRQRTKKGTELFTISDLIMADGYERYAPKAIQRLEEKAIELDIMRITTLAPKKLQRSFELRSFNDVSTDHSGVMAKNLTPSCFCKLINIINPLKLCKK